MGKRGKVSIENFEGRLRFRFSYNGAQRSFHAGLAENPENRKQAEVIAKQIELDIATGNFDTSLERYKRSPKSNDTVLNTVQKYLIAKEKELAPASLFRHKALLRHLKDHALGNKMAGAVLASDIDGFLRSLKCSNPTAKRYLELLRAAGVSIPERKLKSNPKQPTRPFNQQEVKAILVVLAGSHYERFVKFLLCTGARIGEARALRWQHITETGIWIGEALDRWHNVRSTKTGKTRIIPINDNLRTILGTPGKSEDLVFTSIQGTSIDSRNFARSWEKLLLTAGVEYRKPYTLRATFVSTCLQSGMSPLEVASLCGHSSQVLYQHYAGLITSPQIPSFF